MPQETSFPIPLKYIDVVRHTNTTLDVLQESPMIGNYLGHGRSVHPVQLIEYDSTSGIHVVREGIDKDLSNVQARVHMARSLVLQKRRNSIGERKKSKLDNTRGISHFDPEDMEFNETMTNARKKLELQVDSAMLCKLRKTSGNSSLTALKDPQEMICDEHEQ